MSLTMPEPGGSQQLDWISTFDFPFPELPQLVHIARLTIDKTTERVMDGHTHDFLELHYMDSGVVRWWADEGAVDVVGGDVYIVRPGELHGGVLSSCVHYTLHLRPPGFGERYFELPPDEAATLATALTQAPVRCAPAGPSLSPQLERLMVLAAQRAEGPDPLLVVEARGLVLNLLSRMALAGRGAEVPQQDVPSFSASVVQIIEASLGKPLSASDIADRMGCSVSQLHHRFQAEFGLSVKNFYLRRRINESCRRLEQTAESITDIAYGLGFSSSQHFATTFRRFVGMSPRAFRQGMRIPDHSDPWPDTGNWAIANAYREMLNAQGQEAI